MAETKVGGAVTCWNFPTNKRPTQTITSKVPLLKDAMNNFKQWI